MMMMIESGLFNPLNIFMLLKSFSGLKNLKKPNVVKNSLFKYIPKIRLMRKVTNYNINNE